MFEWLYGRLVEWLTGWFGGTKAVGDAMLGWLLAQASPYLPDAGGALSVAGIQTLLGQINYFVPLSEIVVYATAYAALWAVVAGYRFVKSWFVGASS
jgi:hypothetical protein